MMILQVMVLLVRAICEMREVLPLHWDEKLEIRSPKSCCNCIINPTKRHTFQLQTWYFQPFFSVGQVYWKGCFNPACRMTTHPQRQACQEAMHLGLIWSSNQYEPQFHGSQTSMRTPPSVFSPKRNNMKQPSLLFVLVQLTPPARPHLPRTSRSSSFERGPGEHPGMDSGSVKMFIEHLSFQNRRFPETSQSSSQESLIQRSRHQTQRFPEMSQFEDPIIIPEITPWWPPIWKTSSPGKQILG